MHASAAAGLLAGPLPGVAWTDLRNVSITTGVIAIVAVAIGVWALHALARRSIGMLLVLISAVTVATSIAGVGGITWLMLGDTEYRTIIMELLIIAGIAGFAVALIVGRRLTKVTRALLEAVHKTGDNGLYIPPVMPLPAELAGLSDELLAAHERLSQARSRERALEASRRELVAWVSHDLRTPLAGLRAMSEALEDQVVVDPREMSAYHTQIRREVDRLSVMIDDLFELSRIHAGALRLNRRPVALEDMVAEVLASVEPVARAKGVRLTGSAVRGTPIFVDAAEFGRALRNLVTNAVRHTPSDGTVEIQGDVREGTARFSVSDACGGIPPEDLPRVFDVAFRGEAARTPGPQEGAGLGLSIARGIVEAHAGQIAVRNAGVGCQFLIRLPLARSVPQPVAPPAWTGPQRAVAAGR
ncbi:MAG TPA: HAMP domain-containing sensor histidine kinase [Streptosporangiaceae bacterium]|nr:HAMP domain-containing sensor histidine kinase [Streptosporangiaceae bacterium]